MKELFKDIKAWFLMLYDIRKTNRQIKELIDKQQLVLNYQRQLIAKQEGELRFLKSFFDVGVDINEVSNSWAVICLHGKKDYIKFYNLGEKELIYIKDFLGQFKDSNKVVDLPFRFDKDIFL